MMKRPRLQKINHALTRKNCHLNEKANGRTLQAPGPWSGEGDTNPSLSITATKDGKIGICCHAGGENIPTTGVTPGRGDKSNHSCILTYRQLTEADHGLTDMSPPPPEADHKKKLNDLAQTNNVDLPAGLPF